MNSFKRYIRRYGLPQSVYLDRYTTYKSVAKQTIEEELDDIRPMSHFEKSLAEFGVEVIHAYLLQAKGRIERQFGTFQDRLVKQMRLVEISDIPEGNAFLDGYLPKYNRKFAKEPAKWANYHRPVVNKSSRYDSGYQDRTGVPERLYRITQQEALPDPRTTSGRKRSSLRRELTAACESFRTGSGSSLRRSRCVHKKKNHQSRDRESLECAGNQ